MGKLFSGAEIVFKVLEHNKVEHIFGYPGGAVLPIYDELKKGLIKCCEKAQSERQKILEKLK